MRTASGSMPALSRLLLMLILVIGLLNGAAPVGADGGVKPGPTLRCVFEGAQPDPGSTRQQVVAVSIAFRCFDAGGRQVLRLFDAQFFVDGVARNFQRAGEFGTEILFVEFPGGLSAGVHTAKVVVEGNGSFSWSFTVASGGASHRSAAAASSKAAPQSANRAYLSTPFNGLIAACHAPGALGGAIPL